MTPIGYDLFSPPAPKLPKWIIVPALIMILIFCYVFAHADTPPATLTASWYSIASLKQEGTYKYSKGVMANGKLFNDTDFTCATRLFNLGSRLVVTNLHTGRRVTVKVTDRIGKRFATKRIDLSRAAFQQICSLDKGLCKVTVEVIK